VCAMIDGANGPRFGALRKKAAERRVFLRGISGRQRQVRLREVRHHKRHDVASERREAPLEVARVAAEARVAVLPRRPEGVAGRGAMPFGGNRRSAQGGRPGAGQRHAHLRILASDAVEHRPEHAGDRTNSGGNTCGDDGVRRFQDAGRAAGAAVQSRVKGQHGNVSRSPPASRTRSFS